MVKLEEIKKDYKALPVVLTELEDPHWKCRDLVAEVRKIVAQMPKWPDPPEARDFCSSSAYWIGVLEVFHWLMVAEHKLFKDKPQWEDDECPLDHLSLIWWELMGEYIPEDLHIQSYEKRAGHKAGKDETFLLRLGMEPEWGRKVPPEKLDD